MSDLVKKTKTVKERPFFAVNEKTKDLLLYDNQIILDILSGVAPLAYNWDITGLQFDSSTLFSKIQDVSEYQTNVRYTHPIKEFVENLSFIFDNLSQVKQAKNYLPYLKLCDNEGNSLDKYQPMLGLHVVNVMAHRIENELIELPYNVYDTSTEATGINWFNYQSYTSIFDANTVQTTDINFDSLYDDSDFDNNQPNNLIISIPCQLIEQVHLVKFKKPSSRDWKFELLQRYRAQKQGKQIACSVSDNYSDVFAVWAGMVLDLPFERIEPYIKRRSDFHNKTLQERCYIIEQLKPLIECIGLDFSVTQ